MTLASRAFSVLLLLSSACRSLDGLSGGSAATDAGADADAATPSCAPSASAGTICAKVSVESSGPVPGYGAFSGASNVKADGHGFVNVYLFDKDPSDPKNGQVLPKLTLRHPPAAGSEVSLETLPAELVGTAAPGTYWLFALFEDNALDPRGSGLLSSLPGDFVTRIDIENKASLFPKVTLAIGETSSIDLPMVPLRELVVSSRAGNYLLGQAQSNPNVHGSGPASFFLYDGDLSRGAPAVVDFGKVACLDLQLQNPNRPELVTTTLKVTATGQHNVFGNLYDYTNPAITGSLPPGTLSTDAAFPPEAIVDATTWTSAVEVEFDDVENPPTGTVADLLVCN